MAKKKYGYTCPCGKFNEAHEWAIAHWNEELIHCEACGAKNTIQDGKVLESTPKAKEKSHGK